MSSRPLGPTQKPQRKIQAPDRKVDWHRLMQQVIRRAEQLGDRQLEGLRRALADGKAEQTLRRMGVIHSVDIDREFPLPEKNI
jgi:hypothetical protein